MELNFHISHLLKINGRTNIPKNSRKLMDTNIFLFNSIKNMKEGEYMGTKPQNIKELSNVINLVGKKICIQPLISNDEIGNQCIIVVMNLYDNNDVSNVLHRLSKEKTKSVQNKLVSLLHNTKDDKLKKEFVDDLNLLDYYGTMAEIEYQKSGPKENIGEKCRCFILSIRPDLKIELRRMDTDENIDIENIGDLFEVLIDNKYDFIY
jgi:NADH dehydrogenase/NADH:ubiquinone oxidoreductase subunit G